MKLAVEAPKIKGSPFRPGMPRGLVLYESSPTTARCDWCGADVELTTGAVLQHARSKHYRSKASVFMLTDDGLIIHAKVRP